MAEQILRPRADSLLRNWAALCASEADGPGFGFDDHRQAAFEAAADAFLRDPTPERFEAVWSEGTVVGHENPTAPLLLSSLGGVDDAASFLETLSAADEYDPGWEDDLVWSWALWEFYSRLNADAPGILTQEAADALRWFGIECTGGFRARMDSLAAFRDRYLDVAGHATAGTPHESSVRVEMEQLFHAITSLESSELAPQLKGPYGDFYRLLYGGSELDLGRSEPVRPVEIGPLAYAYAHAKVNDAYDRPDSPGYYGGATFWENWKDSYCRYVEETVRAEFTLDDLAPAEIEPLFEALTDRDATDLGASVIEYLMGGQWGQYVWNDVEEHFVQHPDAASAVLSEFFDRSKHEVPRLRTFREHTIHVTNEEGRSPGSVERMATSLLMVTDPGENVGLPPSKTETFVEAKTSLEDYDSGFRPRQYGVVVPALRTVRDEIQRALEELGADESASMLDVHNLIWMYQDNGDPARSELPTAYRE